MADRKRWMRWALYAVQLLLLFVLQETPGLLPPVMGAKPMLILAAALTIATVPVVLLYIVAQKKFIQGLTAGAVKDTTYAEQAYRLGKSL